MSADIGVAAQARFPFDTQLDPGRAPRQGDCPGRRALRGLAVGSSALPSEQRGITTRPGLLSLYTWIEVPNPPIAGVGKVAFTWGSSLSAHNQVLPLRPDSFDT